MGKQSLYASEVKILRPIGYADPIFDPVNYGVVAGEAIVCDKIILPGSELQEKAITVKPGPPIV